MNKKVYCEFECLKYFIRSCPNPMEDWDGAISWKMVFDFLYYADKYIDVPLGLVREEAMRNHLMLKLVKNGHFYFIKDYPNLNSPQEITFDAEKKNSIFFSIIGEKQKEKVSSSYGVIILGIEDIPLFSKQYGKKHIPIGKRSAGNWKALISRNMMISNALIISDNYILSDTKKMDENVVELLDALLPYTSKTLYSIFIYTYDMKENAQGRYNIIQRKIEELRPNLNFKLTICKVNKDDFHDRNLITNNIYIECGSGFDLFSNGKSSKRTNLRIAYPFMNFEGPKDSEMEAYLNLISDIIKVEKREHCYNKDYWGDKDKHNDLISYYKGELLS